MTKGGLKYRNYCHQCAYNNNRFNILAKERLTRALDDVESEVFDMTLQLFDTYASMGGTIGSGEYNRMRGRTQREATLEEQLAHAQALVASKVDVTEYVSTDRYTTELDMPNVDNELAELLMQSMEVWCTKQYKPSFLRAVCADLKSRLLHTDDTTPINTENSKGINKLSTKIWDYEEYLAETFKADLPEWLNGEELIV